MSLSPFFFLSFSFSQALDPQEASRTGTRRCTNPVTSDTANCQVTYLCNQKGTDADNHDSPEGICINPDKVLDPGQGATGDKLMCKGAAPENLFFKCADGDRCVAGGNTEVQVCVALGTIFFWRSLRYQSQ